MPELSEVQKRIDAIDWYHEFDFPGGLKARSKAAEAAYHRRIWDLTEQQLDQIDFRGKSVLDIGCWDGKWSFYAERRGASRVLASDDKTQNWGGGAGLALAKDLMGSGVETRQDVSIYRLDALRETFDIILCLGVYYHLLDPFYAFAQVRQRCRGKATVVFEGDVTTGMRPHTAQMDLVDQSSSVFIPTIEVLSSLLRAAYFEPVAQSFAIPIRPPTWREKLTICAQTVSSRRDRNPPRMNRALTVCRPFEGKNPLHTREPPFGLGQYDPRFRTGDRLSGGTG